MSIHIPGFPHNCPGSLSRLNISEMINVIGVFGAIIVALIIPIVPNHASKQIKDLTTIFGVKHFENGREENKRFLPHLGLWKISFHLFSPFFVIQSFIFLNFFHVKAKC